MIKSWCKEHDDCFTCPLKDCISGPNSGAREYDEVREKRIARYKNERNRKIKNDGC